ncbi:MAG: amidase family protein [Candidatus Woesearchaeota archaeon]
MDSLSIKEKLKKLREGVISAEENIKGFLKKIDKDNNDYNIFLHVNKDALKQAKEIDKKIKEKKAGKLAGLAIAVKSCINVKGLPITCASKTLENYIGTYDSDAIKKIKKEDGIIIGMVNMDEFASGNSGETSYYGPTKNPACLDVVPGGSSSGSGAAVAAQMCDLALGTDTGGSVRSPASHCGIVGVKPSYGRVSRFGLIDLSMSFDQIGVLSPDVYGAEILLEVISGYSENDAITKDEPVQKYTGKKETKLRVGFSVESEKLSKNKELLEIIKKKAEKLCSNLNLKLIPVDLEYTKLAVQTYYPIVYVEFFSGTRKFDGRKYGHVIEETCGKEALRRILGGKEISKSEYHGSYYKKALAVKSLVKNDFEKAFKKVDVILSPVTPNLPHKLGDNLMAENPEEGYAQDAFTIPANLAGICGGVVNAGKINGIPVGIQILAPEFREDLMFSAMELLEKLSNS